MEKKIDLHIHTNKSDGKLSPKEVIDEAVKNKVSTIAIADHDTIEAYNDELFNYAKERNINLIPAVEISTKTKKINQKEKVFLMKSIKVIQKLDQIMI